MYGNQNFRAMNLLKLYRAKDQDSYRAGSGRYRW